MRLFSLLSVLSLLPAAAAAAPPAERPIVAVIDSGVARTTELAPLLVAEYDMGTQTPREAFAPRYDHGTMVATILAREAKHEVGILSFRIDDETGCPEGAAPPCQAAAAPIERAIREATRLNVDAINISLTLSDDPGIVDAIRDAGAHGITVVLAAGNDGLDRPKNLSLARAAFPYAVLVGAVDSAGAVWSGTNRPEANPAGYHYAWQWGVNVPTTAANGTATMATGTSFAAPIETARLLTARRQTTAALTPRTAS